MVKPKELYPSFPFPELHNSKIKRILYLTASPQNIANFGV